MDPHCRYHRPDGGRQSADENSHERLGETHGPAGVISNGAVGLKLLAAVGCLGVALIAYTLSLRHFQLTVAYPLMTAGTIVVILLASMMFLHEGMTIGKAVGTTLAVAGIIILALNA